MEENRAANEPFNEFQGATRINIVKVKYEWKVYNFSVCGKETGECIDSPKFSAPNDDIEWTLMLYPKGDTPENKDYLSLYLLFEQTKKTKKVEAKLKFSILDKHHHEHFEVRTIKHYKESIAHGYPAYEKRSEILNGNFLPNDCLTIVCKITAGRDIENLTTQVGGSGEPMLQMQRSQYQLTLFSNQESLWNNQEFHDVKLVASGKEFYAHKTLLAAQSPVFFAMFKNDMMERNQNHVDLVDVEYNVLEEAMRFIYSGKIKNIEAIINDLLALADKYAIETLKNKCEEYLFSKLSTDNVVDIISLSDLYNAGKLRKHAIDFFISHKEEIVNSNGFASIQNLQSNVLKEIIHTFMMK